MLTEKDARLKWCPHIRLKNGELVGYNRSVLTVRKYWKVQIFRFFFPRTYEYTQGRFFHCQGSGCMMWHWAFQGQTHGYCGLSGTPNGAARDPVVLPAAPVEQPTRKARDWPLVIATLLAAAITTYVYLTIT